MERFVIKKGLDCGYHRMSDYIYDTEHDSIVLVLDPSEGEYCEACAESTFEFLCRILNKYAPDYAYFEPVIPVNVR